MVYHKLQHFISKYAIPQAITYFVEYWYITYASFVTHNVNAYILINNEIKTLYKSSLHLQVQNKNGLIVRSFLTPWYLICIFIACIKYELREFAFFMGVTIVL